MKKNIVTVLVSISFIFLSTSVSFSYTPGSAEVTVKDFHSGTLLEGAAVEMEPGGHTGITGSDGTVTLTEIIPYRNYVVTVSLAGYIEGLYGEGKTGLVWVQTGQTTPVTIPIKKKASITGQVTSDGSPVAGAWVVLVHDPIMPSEGSTDLHIARTKTNASGDYELPSVPSGDYRLVAVADSYYQASDNLTIGADDSLTHDFSLTPGTPSLTYFISPTNTIYGTNSTLRAWNGGNLLLGDHILEKYIDVINSPPGEDFELGSDPYKFLPMGPGNYTVAMMVVDLDGIGIEETSIITMVNSAPEAYPSIIPGPSELPLLYNSTVYASSAGTGNVTPGTDVYLRGWGRDINLESPEKFNPGAPMFDVYGNKNGDWSQSAFSFEWSLRDGSGTDRTSLLNSTISQNVHFTVPAGAISGDEYIATLTVTDDDGLAGAPAEVSVVVAQDSGNCAGCHSDVNATYVNTTHNMVAVDCENCHGSGSEHMGNVENITVTHWPGNCGSCHDQFAQWQKSRHSDPLAFGHAEIAGPLLGVCYKCHYTEGFIGAVESPEGFKDFRYPLFPPPSVPKDTPNVGCDVCHDPHDQSANPVGIRTGSEASLCGTCHEEKWQNATYTAHGGEIGNAYHWPETDYTQYEGSGNLHQMPKGCVTCHMAKGITDTDSNGVLKVGTHTMRMRDVGPDGNPGTADDLLNITACETCHPGLTTFDRNSATTRIKNKHETLGDLLKVNNHEYLPPFQPGKCATCHRGGTLPFIDETATKTLENAYLNYKLILHDRSFGIHNPGYIERLLDDSIAAISDIDDSEDEWDLNDDGNVDKADLKQLKLDQKEKRKAQKLEHKADKEALKAVMW